MERRLPINVGAVDIDFVVCEQCDDIVDICLIDSLEEDFVAHLLY